MPANMISAPLASTFVVMGNRRATVTAGPTPGSTPTAVPSMQPTRHHMRFWAESATANPLASWAQTSMALEDRFQRPLGQAEPETVVEDREDRGGEQEPGEGIEEPSAARESARHQDEERGRSDHEARPLDAQAVNEDARGDPAEGQPVHRQLRLGLFVHAAVSAGESFAQQESPERDEADADHARHHRGPDLRVAAAGRQVERAAEEQGPDRRHAG